MPLFYSSKLPFFLVLTIAIAVLVGSTSYSVQANSADSSGANTILQTSERHGMFVESSVPVPRQQSAAIRTRTVTLSGDLLGDVIAAESAESHLTLNLFDDVVMQVKHAKTQLNQSGSTTWIGEIPGMAGSSVILVVRDGMIYGSVDALALGSFSIRPISAETHAIEQISPYAILTGATDTVIPPSLTGISTAARAAIAQSALTSSDDGSIIDVYIAYDQDAAGGSVAAVDAESWAELFIAYTNLAYENSGIDQRVWLVGIDGYNHTDTNPNSLNADLEAATNGTLAGIQAKRDELHADLVMFWVPIDGTTCSGLAWLQTTSDNVAWQAYGYAAMEACSYGQNVFAHELGHNMGSRHDWYMDDGLTPVTTAHGFVDTNANFRTMMAYGNRCAALGISCPRIPFFSNPSVSYNGAPTGVVSGTASDCTLTTEPTTECDSDNTTNFNNKAATTAKFRDSQILWTGSADTNWTNAANWTINEGAPGATTAKNRLPRLIDNIYIPSGLTNYPAISGSTFAREIIIEPGAALSMSAGTLTVGGTWQDNGGFTASGGTVVFGSPINQNITSSASSVFHDVQFGKGNTQSVKLLSDLNVNGDIITIAGAQLLAGNNDIFVAGNWDDQAGGFSAESSKIILNGIKQTVNTATSSTALAEDFSSYAPGCGCTATPPSGWATAATDGLGVIFGDGTTYHWHDSTDAWLFTSAVELEAGIEYTFQFDYRKGGGESSYELAYGTAQNVGAMSTTLLTIADSEITTDYQSAETTISVATNGTYYLGFHSTQTSFYNRIDNIELLNAQGLRFNDLQVVSGETTFQQPVSVLGALAADAGTTVDLGEQPIAVEGSVENSGMFKQTKVVPNGVTTSFFDISNGDNSAQIYFGVEITPISGSMGETTVEILGNQACDSSEISQASIKRCFSITPTTNQTADIKFYYDSAEANGNNTPNSYRLTSGRGVTSWNPIPATQTGSESGTQWISTSGNNTFGTFFTGRHKSNANW